MSSQPAFIPVFRGAKNVGWLIKWTFGVDDDEQLSTKTMNEIFEKAIKGKIKMRCWRGAGWC